MAGDDILWRNVEAMKEQSPSASKDAPKRTKTRQKRASGAKTVSPPMPITGGGNSPLSTSPEDATGVVSSSAKTHPRQKITADRSNVRPAKRRHERTPAIDQADTVEGIRKVVRVVGKEVSFVRLTTEEKRRLSEVVYTYKRQGIKTSENELLRIGLAILLDDYQASGKASLLESTLASLNA